MQRYSLDANILIEAKNGPYGFDIVPAFWKWLDEQISKERIFCSKFVYDEIVYGDDELAVWIKERKKRGFIVEPNDSAQIIFKDIADYVGKNYPSHRSSEFLAGADPWIIAQAKSEKAIVVTGEVLAPNTTRKVKIPNICKEFKVPCMGTYDVLRKLKASF
ncbi:MAG: DUF4411 family protein [Deltaproteobacteria bacterium]|nr:DUF4411 family protein [Deltaproteobacteria bacterium]